MLAENGTGIEAAVEDVEVGIQADVETLLLLLLE